MLSFPHDIQRALERLQFTCLDDTWVNRKAEYRFLCPTGHVLKRSAHSLVNLFGCELCRRSERMLVLHRKAGQAGSRCLDESWHGRLSHYAFECLRNPDHQWQRTYASAMENAHCPHCVRAAQTLRQLEGGSRQALQAYVASRKGQGLWTTYVGLAHKYRFRCATGHVWVTEAADMLRRRTWCPHCGSDRKRSKFEQLQKLAQERGGSLLAQEYNTSQQSYTWLCANGHTWSARPESVKRGVWCPQCSPRQPYQFDIESLREAALARGGACISLTYRGSKEAYLWKCGEGHAWQASWTSVRRGSWCRKCASARHKLSLEELKQAARDRGGSCLSKHYEGIATRYHWRCRQGHSWFATYPTIRRGGWCRVCASLARAQSGGAEKCPLPS